MAIQTINIGNIANDGTGDDLREAFIKVNNNFSELNNNVTAIETDGENLGTGQEIFAQKSDNKLQFKTILAGQGITLSPGGSTLSITADSGVTQVILISDDGSKIIPGGASSVNMFGGQNIDTQVENGNFKIKINGNNLVAQDTSPTLGGDLNGNAKNISSVNTMSAVTFNGSLEGLVYGIDIRNLPGTGFDYGSINTTATNAIEFFLLTTDQDFGTITSPESVSVELGTLV